MKARLFFLLLVVTTIKSWCQLTVPPQKFEVARPSPDFQIHDIQYYHIQKASLSDFKGKWLVLDFWNRYCTGCIQGFPRMNELQKEFGDQVQIMLVGQEDKDNLIRKVYAKYREKLNLSMPSGFDSLLFQRFGIFSGPYLVIIDPEGTVRGITYELSREHLAELLAGKAPDLPKVFTETPGTQQHDVQPFEENILYSSVLTRGKNEEKVIGVPVEIRLQEGRFRLDETSLKELFMFAYVGKKNIAFEDSLYEDAWREPVFELGNPSSGALKMVNGKELFSYTLTMPQSRSEKRYLMEVMQREMKNVFGYDARFEVREMPRWELTATSTARKVLKTSGRKTAINGSPIGVTLKNQPLSVLLRIIANNHPEISPVINNTGISEKVDISIDWLVTDLGEIRKGLQARGLDLIQVNRKMRVLVVRDRSLANDHHGRN